MNADRRKQIEAVISNLNNLQAIVTSLADPLYNAVSVIDVEGIKDGEQEAYDDLPNPEGEKGQTMEEAIEAIEAAGSCITELKDELIHTLENICTAFEDKIQEAVDALQSAKGE